MAKSLSRFLSAKIKQNTSELNPALFIAFTFQLIHPKKSFLEKQIMSKRSL